MTGKHLDLPEQKVCEFYYDGKSSREIGKIYNCSASSIDRLLKKHNVTKRVNGDDKRINLPSKVICDLYRDGKTLTEISQIYGTSRVPITRILKNNHVEIRIGGNKDIDLLNLPTDDICNHYLDGMSVRDISILYGCSERPIKRRLINSGINIRSLSESHKIRIDTNIKNDITNKYNNGITIQKLTSIYGMCHKTIREILSDADIIIRSKHESKKLDLPMNIIKQMYEDDQYYPREIGELYNVSGRTIIIRLREIGVEIRPLNQQKIVDDNPEARKRASARMQGQNYDKGEWTGYANKERPYLIPISACIQLNPKFKGCNRHHIMSGVIINIPGDLHMSIRHMMPHDNREGKNMKEINELAYNYLIGNI